MRRKTIMHYSQLIRDYIVPFIGQITLGNLRGWHIQELYTRLTSQGVGIYTIRKVHKLLHSTLESAVDTGVLGHNPASSAHPPNEPLSEMKTLDETGVSQFLVTISTHKWEPLFYLACTGGMRRGELLGLQWSDLDWIKQTITIQRQLASSDKNVVKFQSPKTRSSRRTIAIGDRTIQILRAHYDRQQSERLKAGSNWIDHDLIFCNSKGGPIGASNLGRVFHRLLKIAGLPQLRFHDLRHTSASLMLNNGIAPIVVSKRLGHLKTSTTFDVYGHLFPSMQSEAAAKIEELITPENCTKLHQTTPELHRGQ